MYCVLTTVNLLLLHLVHFQNISNVIKTIVDSLRAQEFVNRIKLLKNNPISIEKEYSLITGCTITRRPLGLSQPLMLSKDCYTSRCLILKLIHAIWIKAKTCGEKQRHELQNQKLVLWVQNTHSANKMESLRKNGRYKEEQHN